MFHHESLDVYRVALEVVRWFHVSDLVRQLARPRVRDLDTCMTSMVLNIAEGNGRCSDGDHTRFIDTAHRAAIKVSAQLDLCEVNGQLSVGLADEAQRLLVRVASMTGAWIGSLRE